MITLQVTQYTIVRKRKTFEWSFQSASVCRMWKFCCPKEALRCQPHKINSAKAVRFETEKSSSGVKKKSNTNPGQYRPAVTMFSAPGRTNWLSSCLEGNAWLLCSISEQKDKCLEVTKSSAAFQKVCSGGRSPSEYSSRVLSGLFLFCFPICIASLAVYLLSFSYKYIVVF